MALRLIEIALPENEKHKLEELKDDTSIELWQEDSINSGLLVRILIPAEIIVINN